MTAWLLRRRRALLLLPWLLLVGLMLAGGYYTYYVAAWHGWLQLIGLGLLLLCLFGTWAAPPAAGHARGEESCGHAHGETLAWPALVVQWAPLFVFLAMGPTTLSLTGAGLGAAGAQARLKAAPPGANQPAPAPPRFEDGYRVLNLLELHQLYVEKGELPEKVAVVGRGYVLTEAERSRLAPDQRENRVEAFLYRFVISCCTADARPVSVVIQGRGGGGLRTDNWYQARGRLLVLPGPSRSLAIELDELREAPAPDPPYIVAAF
ncbi:MAG: hypothetical protein ACOZHQ_18170 [Thermodesulfobacteriota bacterium]